MNDFTLDDARQAVQALSSDAREDWLQVGMALRAEFGDAAWDIFDSWSQGSERYKAADCKHVWKSFSKSGVGIGTLIKMAKDAGWRPADKEWSDAERDAYRAKVAADKRKREEEATKEQAWKERMALVVAHASAELLSMVGSSEYGGIDCPYLATKQVGAFGVYVVPYSIVVAIDDQAESFRIVTGEADIKAFFADYAQAGKPEYVSVRNIKRGSLLVPLFDGRDLWSVQIIFPSGKKSFFRHGRKSGCFHVISGNTDVVCVAEGYATAASIRMATGYACVVAIDAGNLVNVLPVVREMFSESELLICADDDSATEENAGIKYANKAANGCGASVVVPVFSAADEVA